MKTSAEFLKIAQQLEEQASTLKSPGPRKLMLEAAAQWRHLARDVSSTSGIGFVGEPLTRDEQLRASRRSERTD